MNGQERTTTAERTSFVVSAAVLLVLVGAICYLWTMPREPAAPMIKQIGETRVVDSRSYVTVEVRNAGDETAQAVQVTAELKLDGAVVVEGEQIVDLLSDGESKRLAIGGQEGCLTVNVETAVGMLMQLRCWDAGTARTHLIFAADRADVSVLSLATALLALYPQYN